MQGTEQRVALVTGGGSGIGRATAELLHFEGVRVGVLEVRPERAVEVARELGGGAMPLVADVADPAQVERAVGALTGAWKRLDLVVANAGINGVTAPLDEIEPDEWARTLAVNLQGTFHTFKYSLPWLRRQGGACVITASVQGTRVFSSPGTTAYACAKAALVAFAKKAAAELRTAGIRVNVICPGAVATHMRESTIRRDLERITPAWAPPGISWEERLRPEQVARTIAFLLSDAASGITGTEIWIDQGRTLQGA